MTSVVISLPTDSDFVLFGIEMCRWETRPATVGVNVPTVGGRQKLKTCGQIEGTQRT